MSGKLTDWEQTLWEAAEKGLITFGTTRKSGDILLNELRIAVRKRDLLMMPLLPEHELTWRTFAGRLN